MARQIVKRELQSRRPVGGSGRRPQLVVDHVQLIESIARLDEPVRMRWIQS